MDVEQAMERALPRRFAVLHSADADEVRHFVSRVLTPYRVTPVHGSQEVVSEVSIAELGPVSLIHLRHSGDELRAQFTELVSYYDVHLPLAGENLLECGEDRVILRPWEKAGIISPQMRANMHLSDGYTQLHIRIERFALERRLEIMLGRPVLAPVRFQLDMDLTAPALASLFRAVNLLIQDLEDPGGLGTRGDGAGPWAEFIITGLLLAQPHNYSEAVSLADATRTLPARVKRVLDLIDDEPSGAHALSQLAAKAGVSPRSLQRDFNVYLGVSPRQYIERVRLARAHADLATGVATTVADVAYLWGFGHVSRFAAAYQKQYGEMPSETLRSAVNAARSRS